VGHAFFWPGTPPFSAAARDDAWSRILALLASDLPGGNRDLPGHNNSGLSRNGCHLRGKRSPLRMDMTVWEWFGRRSFQHRDFGTLTAGDRSTTLILPARNVAATIGPILDTVEDLRARTGLPGQVVVVDADSPDGTADIARAHGAEVYSENELLPEYGPAQGKGDAMWRGLSVARGDIVMFADTDTADFGEHFVYGTLGPLLADPAIVFCKAAYRRPFATGERPVADGGGRVTELMAKPMLNRFYPELTGFVQPLAGEFAARADLLASLPFLTGYGVEIGLLIDVLAGAGLAAMAQVDLGVRQNRHQSLRDLAKMSSVVLHALSLRVPALERHPPVEAPGLWALRQPEIYLHAVATEDGLRLDEHLTEVLERPPLARVAAAERTGSLMPNALW
jgi:glucosyl-3-phosphoglycerate synthase